MRNEFQEKNKIINFNTGNNNHPDSKRCKIYYDNKPSNAYEFKHKICFVIKSSGQTIRFSESEALEMLLDLTKALKWKVDRLGRDIGR
jgi:hypothetical protein